jgi:flagellar motor switch protein FliN/FliY
LAGLAEENWAVIGRHILKAAGVEESESADQKSTCLEVLGQALSGLAQTLTTRLQREVTCVDGIETAGAPTGGSWAAVEVTLGETTAMIAFAPEPALLDAIERAVAQLDPPVPAAGAASTGATLAADVSPAHSSPVQSSSDESRTFDLLLDVELPVSISFGHARVQLKDVLKLTTGSIVELDRAIVEPVDIVVNNCIIAHGEVVVVEGNFGVRIQRVVSREERVRTLR